MFFKVLAAEEKDIPVLSYAPGPLLTDMSDLLIDSEDEDVRNWAKSEWTELDQICHKMRMSCIILTHIYFYLVFDASYCHSLFQIKP